MDRLVLPDGSIASYVTDPSGIETVIIRRPHSFDEPDPGLSGYTSPFRWYVPHTACHPETVANAPSNATWVNLAGSVNAYYAALSKWWARGETFAVLEHDVICRPDVVESFDACPELWCLYAYDPECPCGNPDCREAWRNMLGCTRFRKELMEQVPDAMSSVKPELWDWHNVCDGLGNNLRAAGFTHHWHRPNVLHHHGVQRDA